MHLHTANYRGGCQTRRSYMQITFITDNSGNHSDFNTTTSKNMPQHGLTAQQLVRRTATVPCLSVDIQNISLEVALNKTTES